MKKDIYVVVCERDLPNDIKRYKDFKTQEIVMETTPEAYSLEVAKKRAESLNGRYGKTRIAKLVFIDEV